MRKTSPIMMRFTTININATGNVVKRSNFQPTLTAFDVAVSIRLSMGTLMLSSTET